MGDDNQGGSGVHAGWVYKDGKKTWYRKQDAGGDPGNGGCTNREETPRRRWTGTVWLGQTWCLLMTTKNKQGGGTLKHDHEKKKKNTRLTWAHREQLSDSDGGSTFLFNEMTWDWIRGVPITCLQSTNDGSIPNLAPVSHSFDGSNKCTHLIWLKCNKCLY